MTRHRDRPFNSWDLLKIIALLLMFVDHAGAYFLGYDLWLRAIGRGAAPIFLFLAGYASSYRFSWEIFLLGCLMTASNIIMGEYLNAFNILFTILLCRAVFDWMEKRKKVIERPWEWFIALTVFAFMTNYLTQYGTLGLMFAASGYMNRRPERYAPKVRQRFLIATMVAYAALFILLFDLTDPLNLLLLASVLFFDYRLLSRFTIRPVNMSRMPGWLTMLLGFGSHYSGYIYAIHLIIISWIAHIPI